ncbi:hypothetical protein CERZMDRAFT_116288 [Cercospora zeae-maydis SCOH1-5]|uniref:Extracellular membrane protein CFEM domain-containing protein n=1 Tax=Cercospora zeae-maydis SCOH1-5 TaxID=717836 RepID=A0A6A6FUQ9_9PEZI|nr:hypothetical protein CERZMDRAFT_116288 [Cercospora zeae-maydis SCOH1-5]
MKYTIFAGLVGLASAAVSATPPDTKTCECYTQLTQCQNAPGANMAQCSSDFASCSGTNPYTGSTDEAQAYFDNLKSCCGATSSNGPVVSATPSAVSSNGPVVSATPVAGGSGKPDTKTCDCYSKLTQCQNAPNANMAQCSSDFASWYVKEMDIGIPLLTASSSGTNPYTGSTDQVQAYFDNLKSCCGAPSSNGPVVSATPSAVSSNGPVVSATPVAGGSGKPDTKTCDCYSKLTQCQNAPNANMAQCSADFASCSGTNPYTGSTDQVQAYFDNLKSCCTPTSSNGPVVSSTPVSGATGGKPDTKICACYSTLGQCQNAPNANMAQCSADFASCSGMNPYTSNDVTGFFNNLKQSCPPSSNGPVPSSTPTAGAAGGKPDTKACGCYAQLTQCQNAPNANMAQCSADYASCSGYNPYTQDTATVQAYFANMAKTCPAGGASGNGPAPTAGSYGNGPAPSVVPSSGATGNDKTCGCYAQLTQCQNAPNANMAQCSADYASCSGYNPYTQDTATVQAYFANMAKTCPAGGASSGNGGSANGGTPATLYPLPPSATSNRTIATYTGAASHARVGAGALAAGMAAMLVL